MKEAAHVTMLQRTPTWYFIRPAKDGFANFLRKFLPEKLAYKITRFKNVRLQDIAFRRAREKPEKVKEFLTNKLRSEEHTSELQSLMRRSYAVFCLKKKRTHT